FRRVFDGVGIDFHGHYAVIVAVPITVGVFGGIRDGSPGGNLVGLDQFGIFGLRAERQTNIDYIRGLGAFVLGVGFNGFDFITGAAVRIKLVDLQTIFLLETGNQITITAPVVRQSNGGQGAFLLGGRDKLVHVSTTGSLVCRSGSSSRGSSGCS